MKKAVPGVFERSKTYNKPVRNKPMYLALSLNLSKSRGDAHSIDPINKSIITIFVYYRYAAKCLNISCLIRPG